MTENRVETQLGRPEQLFGEVAYHLISDQDLRGLTHDSWMSFRSKLDLSRLPRFTRNQLRLLAYDLYAFDLAGGLAEEEAIAQRDLLDDGEPGSGYRGFYRFFDLAVALEAYKQKDDGLAKVSLANARRGLAYDALFAVEHEGRIKTSPPGIRCGTDPMGLWCCLEMICDGMPRGNPWPQWKYNNHRPALPAIALSKVLRDITLFEEYEVKSIRDWIIDRKWSSTFASLLAGVRTRYPVLAVINGPRLTASFFGKIENADNIRYAVSLKPNSVARAQAHEDGIDFYGSAEQDTTLVRFTGRRHNKKANSWQEGWVSEDPMPDFGNGIDIRIDHKGITLNGKPIEGDTMPEEPVVKEPNWGVAERQLRNALSDIEEALEAVAARDAGLALQHLDLEQPTTFPGALQHLRRAMAALRGEI